MKSLIAIPAALLAYVISVIMLCLFFVWFFDKPANWDYFIPIVTSFMAFVIAEATAEGMSGNHKVAALVGILIGIFWVIVVVADIFGNISDIIHAIISPQNYKPDVGIWDMFLFYFDTILSSKIFATVSAICAFGELKEFK